MKKNKSLSTKIVYSIALISLLITIVVYSVSKNINQAYFYNIEVEKANLIARTIEPLIAINIFLDMNSKVNQTMLQLIENPNILAVKVLKNNEIISEIKSDKYNDYINDDSFIAKKTIFQPNSKKEIGTLVLIYSSKEYKELMNQYTKVIFILLLSLLFILMLFSLYIKKLLNPLKEIAKSLKHYSPDKEIYLPLSTKNDEIGLIASALNNMQIKILQYSAKQKNINDILEDKVYEKTLELRKQLYTDTLTGLPNRISLLEQIVKIEDGALLILNIDDFKEINDFFGHFVGDNILKKFSNRLNNLFQKDNRISISRLSGDEFTILFVQKPSLEEFIEVAEKLIRDIEKMIFFHENNELEIRVTIGGAYQIDKALEKADIALKSAKAQQKPFLIYDEKLNIEEQYKDNMEWVKKLKKAIDFDKIVPYFQPIIDNKSGKIASYECLIRLIDSTGSAISPYLFLQIAKKSRQYSTLTKIMIDKSCRYFEHLNYDFSINLSVEDIINYDIVNYIKQKIKTHNVANKIIFEILESEGIENYEEISIFIKEMKLLGCRVAIDDFGSGYSNFEHFLKLNIDYIKIDGTLIKNIDNDENAQIVVETIVDFAKRLNILTVAEFVHSEAVYAKVKELKIDRSQGFFFSEPLKIAS